MLLVTGLSESKSKYGGVFYYVYFKDYETGKSARTCLCPSYRNYSHWKKLVDNYKKNVAIEVDNARINKGMVDADCLPKIMIREI